MNEQIKRLAGDAIAHARAGHAVNIVVPNRESMVELVRACKATGRFDKETRRITVDGGSIQFIAAEHIAVQQAKDIGAPWPHCTSVLFISKEQLPAGVQSVGDLAKQAMAHLERGKAGRLVIDEGDATSHAEPKKKPRKKKGTKT